MPNLILEQIHAWKPPDRLDSEAHARDSLVEFLLSHIPKGADVIPEYRTGTTRIDVGARYERRQTASMGWWIFGGIIGGIIKSLVPEKHEAYIEIKFDLQETTELERLLGQITLYRQQNLKPLVILLTGKTAPHILATLRNTLAQYEDVILIQK